LLEISKIRRKKKEKERQNISRYIINKIKGKLGTQIQFEKTKERERKNIT